MRPSALLALSGQALVTKVALAANINVDLECGSHCELDATGARLTFPTPIVTENVFATTTAIVYYQDLKGSQVVQTQVSTATPVPKPTFTWVVSGVTLTYPTTYAFYTNFVHSFFATDSRAVACQLESSTISLGNSTKYASLIYPIADVTGTLPPGPLITYLESIPTVLAQLGGPVNSSCDPVSSTSGALAGAASPTVTLTTTSTEPGATITSSTVTVPAVSLVSLTTSPRFRNTTSPLATQSTSSTSSTPLPESEISASQASQSRASLSVSESSAAASLSSAAVSLSSAVGSSALSSLSASLSQSVRSGSASRAASASSLLGPLPPGTGVLPSSRTLITTSPTSSAASSNGGSSGPSSPPSSEAPSSSTGSSGSGGSNGSPFSAAAPGLADARTASGLGLGMAGLLGAMVYCLR